MLVGSYNNLLVLFSVLVAMMASYVALDLVGRIGTASHVAVKFWLIGGASALGLGIWSMHFIGMLAFSLPIGIGYDIPLTFLSLVVAIAASLVALWLGSRSHLPLWHLAGGSLLMGGGIAAMHYIGMAAMRMTPGIVYSPRLVVLSVGIAVAASSAALWIAFRLRAYSQNVRHYRLLAALVMGLAIVVMHYTGMAAASFPLGSICGAANQGFSGSALAVPILVVTIAVLAVALITSILDMRLEINTALLSTSLAEANEELSQLALHDTLTRLPNRLLLMDRLTQAIEHAHGTRNHFAVMFIDLDGFKSINDTFGHQVGDQLLIKVAERIKANVHQQDTCARLGGDEFVLVSDVREPADAATIGERLVSVLEEPFMLGDQLLNVSASVGISIYPDNGGDAAELLKNADIAMYHAKSLGRNQACFFENSMNTSTATHLSLLQDLRLAARRGQLQLYYQPKFIAPAGPIIGVEALLRWNHPVRGQIGPDEFIPLAERSGLIVSIGEWVIDEACKQIAEWHGWGRKGLTMAVNISALQFNHPRFLPTIREALQKYALPADSLTLEVTESTAMKDVEMSLEILSQLRMMGVRISIDDFGTGYSSLMYLKRMPASELKIDRGFISGLVAGGEDAAIVSAIVALGETLNLSIVAEGVETDAQQAMLTDLGCNLLQGFLLGRPMPAAQLALLI